MATWVGLGFQTSDCNADTNNKFGTIRPKAVGGSKLSLHVPWHVWTAAAKSRWHGAPLRVKSWLRTSVKIAVNDKYLVVSIPWLGLVALKRQCSTPSFSEGRTTTRTRWWGKLCSGKRSLGWGNWEAATRKQQQIGESSDFFLSTPAILKQGLDSNLSSDRQ